MIHIMGSKYLPCGHQRTNCAKDGTLIRCRTCRKKWHVHLIANDWARDHTQTEAYRYEWEVVD